MKLATLQCNVWIGDDLVGRRCPWNAEDGTRRCGLHRSLPADELRCRFEYAGGQRCSRQVRTQDEHRHSYCKAADHRRACPDGCGGWTPWHDRPCLSCQAARRQQDRATCTLEVDEGVLCGATIKDDAPDPDRCKRHRRDKVHAWGRCQHLYTSGRRCHRSVRNSHAEVCNRHVTACVVCGETTDRADPTTARCKKHLLRCTKAGCEGFPVAGGGGGCFRHPAGGVQGACIAWALWSDAPCTNTDTNDEGLCSKHADVPDDEHRCAVVTPRGRCWNVRDPLHPDDGRCAGHRVGRAWTSGDKPAYQPVDAPKCVGITIVGERCTRNQQDGGPWCTKHAAIAALPDADRCRATVDADGKAWPCVIRPRGAHRLCVVHLQTHEKVGCDQLVGEGTGRPCGQSAAHDTHRCAFHAHEIEPSDDQRCAHTYPTGQRCWHDPIGGAELCPQHTLPCSVAGCPTGVAVLGADRCRDHRPRCTAWTAKGTKCGRAARPDGRCGLHPADAGGCAHIHPDGSKCVWTPAGYSDLCPTHRIACTAPGCTTKTAMADGLCRDHRPICGIDGCRLPIYQGADCFVHARLRAEGTCALLTRKDEPCGRPATIDTDSEGRICATHATIMPPDEMRCLHVHATGQRCAARRETGRAWCHDHSGANNRTCPGLTRFGEPCEHPVFHTPDDTGAWCWTHIPVEADRCRHEADGWRCPLRRRERYATCRWHTASNPRCVGSIFGDCDLPALLDQTWCWTHVPADDADRCRHEADGWRCHRGRRRFEPNCTEHRPYAPRCWATPDGVACHTAAVVDTTTCWKHYGWEEGQMEAHDDDWQRFHSRQYEDLLDEIAELLAISALGLDGPDGQNVVPPVYDEVTFIAGGAGMTEQQAAIPWDPYDLTGARAFYDQARRDGATHDDAQRAALLYAEGLAESTIRGHTAKLQEYLDFCDQRTFQAIPATQVTISLFIAHLTERGTLRDGTALSSTYINSFMGAISKLHAARGMDDPFKTYPQLTSLARGVTRLYSKPQVRAHAIRADELTRMVDLCLRAADPDPRDIALTLLLTTPETAGLSFANIASLTWDDVHLPAEGTGADGTIDYPYRGVTKQVTLPNVTDSIDRTQIPPGETLAVERVCLIAALRRLHMRIVNDHVAGRPTGAVQVNRDGSLHGPVFLNSDGTAVGKTFGPKVLDPICERLGLGRIADHRQANLDVRLRILDALGDVDFVALRDAAILVSMFWASLRVSEAARLSVGDIWWDGQNRGSYVRVRKGKGDHQARTTPVRKAHRNGRPIVIDFRTIVERYWVAYAERLGRDLQVGDAMFIATQGKNTGEAMTRQAIDNVVKKRAADAGITAEFDERISSHGLRAGFATEQLHSGMSAEEVAYLQRRQSTESVYGYFRPPPFDERPRGTIFTGPDAAFDLQTAEDIIREI